MKKRLVLCLLIAILSVLGLQTAVTAGPMGPLMEAYEKNSENWAAFTTRCTGRLEAEIDGKQVAIDVNYTFGGTEEKAFMTLDVPQVPEMNLHLVFSGKKIFAIFRERKEYLVKVLSDEKYEKIKQVFQFGDFSEYLGSGMEMYSGSILSYEDYEIAYPKKTYVRCYFDKNQQMKFFVNENDSFKISFEVLSLEPTVNSAMFEIPSGYTRVEAIPESLKDMF